MCSPEFVHSKKKKTKNKNTAPVCFRSRCLSTSPSRRRSRLLAGAPLASPCLSDSAQSSLTILSHRTELAPWNSPLAVLCRHRGTESPPVHQLAPNFSLWALRLARPLLSCHPSCPDAPRCPLVAIQLFIFLPPPFPQPVGMCRLYDSRDIQSEEEGSWFRPPYFAPRGQFVWSFSWTYCLIILRVDRYTIPPKKGEPTTRNTGQSLPVSPGRRRVLSAVNFKVTGARGWRGWAGSGRGRDGASERMNCAHTGSAL